MIVMKMMMVVVELMMISLADSQPITLDPNCFVKNNLETTNVTGFTVLVAIYRSKSLEFGYHMGNIKNRTVQITKDTIRASNGEGRWHNATISLTGTPRVIIEDEVFPFNVIDTQAPNADGISVRGDVTYYPCPKGNPIFQGEKDSKVQIPRSTENPEILKMLTTSNNPLKLQVCSKDVYLCLENEMVVAKQSRNDCQNVKNKLFKVEVHFSGSNIEVSVGEQNSKVQLNDCDFKNMESSVESGILIVEQCLNGCPDESDKGTTPTSTVAPTPLTCPTLAPNNCVTDSGGRSGAGPAGGNDEGCSHLTWAVVMTLFFCLAIVIIVVLTYFYIRKRQQPEEEPKQAEDDDNCKYVTSSMDFESIKLKTDEVRDIDHDGSPQDKSDEEGEEIVKGGAAA